MHSSDQQEDFGIEQQAFQDLERDFQEVLNELSSDSSLERFRLEYEKLHRALKVSHENEKKLLKRCRDLNADIVGNAAKVQTALKLTQEDSQTIGFLKSELEKTFNILQLSRDREEKSKQKIENLHAEIKHLNTLIDQGNSLSSGQNNTVHDLLNMKEQLMKEKETLNNYIYAIKNEINGYLEKEKSIEEEKKRILNEIQDIKAQMVKLEETVQKDEEKKKLVQDDLEQFKKNYDTSRKDFEKILEDKKQIQKEYEGLQLEIHEKEQELERKMKERKVLTKEAEEIKAKFNDQSKYNDNLDKINTDLQNNFLRLNRQLNSANAKHEVLLKVNSHLKDEILFLKEAQIEAEKLKEVCKMSINELEQDISTAKRKALDDRSLIEEIKRERDILLKELNRAENNNRKQKEEKDMKDKLKKEKINEISGLHKEQERLSKKISNLEKEKEKYGVQAAQANAKYFHSLEEIKLKDNLISEFQKKNIETESKLKQQQNLYEAVRSDRNLYSKNLTETQEEIAEIKRKYRIVNHQITQLKEEIDAKEIALSKEHFEHKKKDKTIEEQQKSIAKYDKDKEDKDEKIKKFAKDIEEFHKIIRESEIQKQKLKEEYDLVVGERDILSTQLIRRKAEAELLYEKIKINQSTLSKGEAQYQEKLGDIEQMKEKIAKVMNDIRHHKISANTLPDLKNEIHNLQKELIEEKLKSKALAEELENPMNVHRWRKLEATDSETYDLMTKIQTLQKRLIAKTEEVSQKDKEIENLEKNLKQLREIMKRQPGAEEAKMIPIYQESLRQKSNQMKAMANELNLYQQQVNEMKFEMETLKKEEQEIKKKYFYQKKKEQTLKARELENQKMVTLQINLPDKRFTGGGFNLAIQS